MSTKVYLLVFTGQGDIIGKLINQEAWNWLQDSQLPLPDSMINDYIIEFKEFDRKLNYEKAKIELEDARDGRFNDKALCIAPSRFNHKEYHDYCHNTKDFMKFCKKHDLELADEWHGYDL